jgi:hypothetical protein
VRRIYKEIVQKNQEDDRFKEFLAAMKTIRELYEKLSRDELLIPIYTSSPGYGRDRFTLISSYLKREL